MRWLRALYFANGLSVGSLFLFIPVLLESKGWSPALIGVATSLGSLSYTIALPAWGHVGDVMRGPRRTLQIASVPAAIFAIGFGLPLWVPAIILCQVVMTAGGGPAMALTDAMAMPVLDDPSREYSRLRLLTSIGAAGGSVVCGLIYGVVGYSVAPIFYVAAMVASIFCAQMVPLGRDSERHRRARASREGEAISVPVHGRFGSIGDAFRIRPRLAAVLLSVTMVFVGVMAATTYITLRITDLGGGPGDVGLANGLGSGAEIPGLILAGWLISRIGARTVLAGGAVGFAVCMLSWVVLVDPLPILATRFLSGIFFSSIFVAYVLTIARMLPAALQSTGQTLLQSACFGVGAIAANLLGGILYGAVGPIGVFGGGALCAVIGGAIGLVALPVHDVALAEPAIVPSVSLAG